jgi:hypothetical protein
MNDMRRLGVAHVQGMTGSPPQLQRPLSGRALHVGAYLSAVALAAILILVTILIMVRVLDGRRGLIHADVAVSVRRGSIRRLASGEQGHENGACDDQLPGRHVVLLCNFFR